MVNSNLNLNILAIATFNPKSWACDSLLIRTIAREMVTPH